jgi:hypothetical protein
MGVSLPLTPEEESARVASVELRRERDAFVKWAVAIFGVGIGFRLLAALASPLTESEILTWQFYGAILTLLLKGTFAYRCARLSRVLGNHWVQTTVYTVCSVLSILYLYPLIALLLEARRELARETVPMAPGSGNG